MRRARTTKAPIVIIEFSRYRSYFRLDLTCLFASFLFLKWKKEDSTSTQSMGTGDWVFFGKPVMALAHHVEFRLDWVDWSAPEKSRTSLTVSMNPLSLEIVETKVIVMGLNMSVLGTLLGLNVPMIEWLVNIFDFKYTLLPSKCKAFNLIKFKVVNTFLPYCQLL